MVYKYFDKKASATHAQSETLAGGGIKRGSILSKALAEELHKPVIRKLKKGKVHSSFIDNIWGADLADMQMISKFNKRIRFSLCFIDIFSKHAWAIPMKDKRGITVTNAFPKILDESNRKPDKIWVDKCSEFCNRSMKSWQERNDIEMYSTHN